MDPQYSGWLSITVSFFALVISGMTAWLTFFRSGELRMTQPTVIFLGPDGGSIDRPPHLKVFLRTLLYSTSRRGQTIESLYVNLQRGESRQNFSIWVYGDGRLARGSGLFVPAEGIACNHHFLLPEDGASFKLLAGDYFLRIYAKKVNSNGPIELKTIKLSLSERNAEELWDDTAGIYFDWGPDQQAYQPHIERKPTKILSTSLFDADA